MFGRRHQPYLCLESWALVFMLAMLAAEAAESSDEESDDDEEESSGSRGSRRAALEARVTELEEQLAEVTREKNTLLAAREALEGDRQEEIKIIQEVMDLTCMTNYDLHYLSTIRSTGM